MLFVFKNKNNNTALNNFNIILAKLTNFFGKTYGKCEEK